MPLKADFSLFLNGEQVESNKEEFTRIVELKVSDLPKKRIDALRENTAEAWEVRGNALVSASFPAGISGTVIVCDRSLKGKSDDLRRSHGFFIRVRGRLINEDDPLFGLEPLSHQTFNHFRADVDANDLDAYLLSSREELEAAEIQRMFRLVLTEVFNEARQQRDDYYNGLFGKERTKLEGDRPFIEPRLVEYPLADALSTASQTTGAEADEGWFYVRVSDASKADEVLQELYGEKRRAFSYDYQSVGKSARMVTFDVQNRQFVLNADHEYVKASADDARSRRMLEDFVTAETLLEVYLRESAVPSGICGEILERRDLLLRGLAKDHAVSLDAIAQDLRDSAADQYMLEIALIRGIRALGFVAKHISLSGEPDGLARLVDYPDRTRRITLEAKSSQGTPGLPQLDFAGLKEHVNRYNADGCLLVAPSYPGESRDDDSAVSMRAKADRISCWTISQFADVVEKAEARHITADEVLKLVLNTYAPSDVTQAVSKLLSDPQRDRRMLYRQLLAQLRALEGKATKSPRSFDMLLGRIVDVAGFETTQSSDIKTAFIELAGASRGALQVSGDNVLVLASLDEIQRRVSQLTGQDGPSRSRGPFREDNIGEEKDD